MAMSLTTLKIAIKDYVQSYEDTFVNNLDDMIRQVEHEIYNIVQLPSQRKTQTGVMTLGNRFLTAPTDFLAPYHMAITDPVSGEQSFLLNKDLSWVREAFPNPTGVGKPTYYAIFDKETFMLSKTPDVAYAVELSFYYYPESIVDAGTGITWLSTNYDMVLLHGCLVHAYMFLKGEPDLLGFYDSKFKEGLQMLKMLSDGKDRQDTYRVEKVRQKVQ
jgi:hypothetical protein